MNTENPDTEREDIFRTGDEEPDRDSDEEYRERLFSFFKQHILSDDSQKRFEAVEAAGQLEYDQRLTVYFAALLKDDDIARNLTGICGIGAWKHTDGAEMLINYFTAENHTAKITPDIEEALLCALGAVGDPQALEFLIDYTGNRFIDKDAQDDLGMASVESITQIAGRGHERALQFLIDHARHESWNLREACAAGLGTLYRGKEALPKAVYEILMELTKDRNSNVRIAAYMSLDEIIGLDEKNKTLLRDARHKQIFG